MTYCPRPDDTVFDDDGDYGIVIGVGARDTVGEAIISVLLLADRRVVYERCRDVRRRAWPSTTGESQKLLDTIPTSTCSERAQQYGTT